MHLILALDSGSDLHQSPGAVPIVRMVSGINNYVLIHLYYSKFANLTCDSTGRARLQYTVEFSIQYKYKSTSVAIQSTPNTS